jgi:PhnB protein
MKAFQPYLNFDGEAREAMTFYHQCFGGDLMIQSFGDGKVPVPPGSEDRILHARINNGSATLMASDVMPGMSGVAGKQFTRGDDMQVNIDCESRDEIDRVFAALSEGAKKITLPLGVQFWGAYFGMLVDKYGVNWMFNYELDKA